MIRTRRFEREITDHERAREDGVLLKERVIDELDRALSGWLGEWPAGSGASLRITIKSAEPVYRPNPRSEP